MRTTQNRHIVALASIFAFRMLGLFMILPVISLYMHKIPEASPTLIGIALGIYGLTQAGLQLPFGMLSDRIGRKPVIIGGLLLFAAGSVVAALSHSIYGIIAGRAVQGAGAVGSTLMALMADITPPENRTKAMAAIGMMIGISFFIAMIIGPALSAWIKLSGIFWLTSILALCGILILMTVPSPMPPSFHSDVEAKAVLFKQAVGDKELLRLDLGIATLHAILTACFIALPIALYHRIGIEAHNQTYVYLFTAVPAFFMMVPFIIVAEKKQKMKPVLVGAVICLLLTQILLMLFFQAFWMVVLCLLLFFAAFSLLEALLPSLVSKRVLPNRKGTAMGIYSTSQFLGIFAGGVLGGWVLSHFSIRAVFGLCAVLAMLWLIVAFRMQPPSPPSEPVQNPLGRDG